MRYPVNVNKGRLKKRERQSLPMPGSWDWKKKEYREKWARLKIIMGKKHGRKKQAVRQIWTINLTLFHSQYLLDNSNIYYSQVPRKMVKLCITSLAGWTEILGSASVNTLAYTSARAWACEHTHTHGTQHHCLVKWVSTLLLQLDEKLKWLLETKRQRWERKRDGDDDMVSIPVNHWVRRVNSRS